MKKITIRNLMLPVQMKGLGEKFNMLRKPYAYHFPPSRVHFNFRFVAAIIVYIEIAL